MGVTTNGIYRYRRTENADRKRPPLVEQELYPHEDEVEKADQVSSELRQEIVRKAIKLGFYA
ncbi:MAG: hypothetical protein Ct9H300mP14_06500 [Gammaproteobacteria bacterium]|nr:MAG: hypothetical protein Ct9H300mP14_06500 [Gammaproteobacteria bacterium]